MIVKKKDDRTAGVLVRFKALNRLG
jgi:hypothetical protein